MDKDIQKKPASQKIEENAEKVTYSPEYVSVIELARRMLKKSDLLGEIREAVERAMKRHPNNTHFFVTYLLRREKALSTYEIDPRTGELIEKPAVRAQYPVKLDCPNPTYGETVFYYNCITDDLIHLWTLPKKEWCEYLWKMREYLTEDYDQMIEHIHDFDNKTLLKKALKKCGQDYTPSGVIITPLAES